MLKLVEFHIDSWDDRQKITAALANSGYPVHVEEREVGPLDTEYWVIVQAQATPKGDPS